jgi:hypothetical protein
VLESLYFALDLGRLAPASEVAGGHTLPLQKGHHGLLIHTTMHSAHVSLILIFLLLGRDDVGHDDTTGGGYRLLCRVVNDPYDILGCWTSDKHFLSGSVHPEVGGSVVASIWLCEPIKPDVPVDEEAVDAHFINVDCLKKVLFKFRNPEGSIYVRYVQNFSRKAIGNAPEVEASLWPDQNDETLMPLRPPTPPMQEELEGYDQDGLHAFVDLPNNDLNDPIDTQDILENETCVIFMCGDKTSVPHQLGFQRIKKCNLDRMPRLLVTPEKVLELNGHIIALALSPDQKQLYINLR